MKLKTLSDKRLTLTVPEVAELLGISVISAYNLAKRQDFPAIRVGKRVVVPRVAFDRWLETAADQQSEGQCGV